MKLSISDGECKEGQVEEPQHLCFDHPSKCTQHSNTGDRQPAQDDVPKGRRQQGSSYYRGLYKKSPLS